MTGTDIITAIVLRVDPASLSFHQAPEEVVRSRFLAPAPDGDVLIGYVSFCKHFCCVPGWRESPTARERGFWEDIFCTCHASAYDPRRIRSDYFMLRVPREELAA
jgi:Rieske Fe-S protein